MEVRSFEQRLLIRFYGVFATVVGLMLVVGVPFFFLRPLAATVACLFVLGVLAWAWQLNRRGRPRDSIVLFSACMWCLFVALMALGLPPTTVSVALAVAATLTIVAGRRFGFVFAASLMLVWLITIVLRDRGLLTTAFFGDRPMVGWIIGAMAVWLVLLPIPEMLGKIRTVNAYNRRLMEANLDPMVIIDMAGRITDLNAATLAITGWTRDELLGRPLVQLFAEPQQLEEAIQPAYAARPVRDFETAVQHRTGTLTAVLCNAFALTDEDGRTQGIVLAARDLSERKRMEAELRELATTDYLTGVSSRRHFMTQLEAEFERVRRHPDQMACVLMIDLDHFKRINDAWGHAMGDEVLRHAASLLQQQARRSDVIGRLGGEEFALLLPSTDAQAALNLAERLRSTLEKSPFAPKGLVLTTSIGVAALDASDADADAVMVRADRALYTAKEAGRNQVVCALAPAPGSGVSERSAPT